MQGMSQNQENSTVPTLFGLMGGLGKALSSHLVLMDITLQGVTDVIVYAAISAVVGYGVKKGIDSLAIYFKKRTR